MLLRNSGIKHRTIANESAVVLQATGQMSFASGVDSAGEILERRVIDFEGNGSDRVGRITERHLPRMPQQTEPGDVGNRVDRAGPGSLLLDFAQPLRSGSI